MKALIAALLFALIAPCFGDGDVVVRVKYDEENGTTEEACTPDDLDSIFGGERRKLRGSRELCVKPSCKRTCCAGMRNSDCLLIYSSKCGCRRRMEEEQRELLGIFTQVDCDYQMKLVEEKYQDAYNGLSSTCKDHVDTRSLDCYKVKRSDNVGTVQINSFNLWNAATNAVVVKGLVEGTSFCGGDFDFSIEAVSGKRVDKVYFEITGVGDFKHNSTDEKKPFTMFSADSKQNVVGGKYAAGVYDLMATPNDDEDMAVFLRFTIKDSSHPDCVNQAVPAPVTCNVADFEGQCEKDGHCQNPYKSLGASACSASGVCYCGVNPCGCL